MLAGVDLAAEQRRPRATSAGVLPRKKASCVVPDEPPSTPGIRCGSWAVSSSIVRGP
jgi:hypothetical protein